MKIKINQKAIVTIFVIQTIIVIGFDKWELC